MKNLIMIIVWISLGFFLGSWLKPSGYLPVETNAIPQSPRTMDKNVAIGELKEHIVANSCQTLPTDVKAPPSKYFVNENTFLTEKSFTLSMAKLDRNDAKLFESLNRSFYGLFEFESEDEYERLLKHGMPTIEELRHVYNTPLEVLIRESIKVIQTADWNRYNGVPEHISRLNALIFNRAVDEFLTEYQIFYPDYQLLNSIGNRKLPDDLKEKYTKMFMASGLTMDAIQTSSARLAKLKFSKLNGSMIHNYEFLSLALLKTQLPTTKVVDTYFANKPPTEAEMEFFNFAYVALSY